MALDSGNEHCAVLDGQDRVRVRGWNLWGQLGDGIVTDRSVPAPVETLDAVVSMACGFYHCLAVSRDGLVWAWGNNESGQIGDAKSAMEILFPVRIC